jgi:hypothetical protein
MSDKKNDREPVTIPNAGESIIEGNAQNGTKRTKRVPRVIT